ncbi:MAG: hypothetical protein Unbinned200contig1002_1 [Prokaryotic dsDNA virus sp.]|jgi:hypothetical protein|nr:hypothetical protein [Flavobacteriaceae bacterium]QDP68300.1 MAG: hypothetical protein Unbinned200contig1002_1 [Prokaryotic dsDNA virus sp.]|tara:strand:- start:28309 stop:28602 length:294 start_codon:yes stop_codon:yes gene_type:complete
MITVRIVNDMPSYSTFIYVINKETKEVMDSTGKWVSTNLGAVVHPSLIIPNFLHSKESIDYVGKELAEIRIENTEQQLRDTKRYLDIITELVNGYRG